MLPEGHVKNIFSKDGLLAGYLTGFEPRDAQLRMAAAVEETLATEGCEIEGPAKILLVEAETGVGKTLAYLIPAILSGQRLVISTATITLQDQILKKEIPLISHLLKKEIGAVCIKGRQNYLCYYRWFQYRCSPQLSFLDNTDCERIEQWLQVTSTGDRAELDWLPDRSPLWTRISAHSHQCLGSECPEAALCFIHQLRRKAGAARLLIVNHHLFFSDLSLRKGGYGEILPRYEGVIFDEAHHLENVATAFFGIHFSQYQLHDLLGDMDRQAEADLAESQKQNLEKAALGIKKRLDRFTALFPADPGRYHLSPLLEKTDNWQEMVRELLSGIDRLIDHLSELGKANEGWRPMEKRAVELAANLAEIALPEEKGDRYVRWYQRRERSISLYPPRFM